VRPHNEESRPNLKRLHLRDIRQSEDSDTLPALLAPSFVAITGCIHAARVRTMLDSLQARARAARLGHAREMVQNNSSSSTPHLGQHEIRVSLLTRSERVHDCQMPRRFFLGDTSVPSKAGLSPLQRGVINEKQRNVTWTVPLADLRDWGWWLGC
jgi:hypothetical protein